MQTTSPKNGKNGLLWVRWSAIWANPGKRQTRPPTTATFPRRTADKSPPQQHDMSSLRVIGHVVLLWFAPCMPWYALLVRTWACYSEPGQPRPHAEQAAHVRNSGFTCGTRWSPGHCRTQPIHDGSWGSHTQARDAAFTGTRQTPPPTTATFPRRTAAKSPPQQHDVSILQVASHHLQHQLFRTNKPKSHHKTNTLCPITLVPYNPEPSRPVHMEGTAGSTSTPHPEPAQAAQATTKPRDSKGIPGQGAETAGFEPARGYAPLPP